MPLRSLPLKTHRSAEGHQQNDCSSCCSPRACWVRAHTSTWRALIPDQTLATKGVSRSSGTDVMTWWCVWPAHRAAVRPNRGSLTPGKRNSTRTGRCKRAVARSRLAVTLTCLRACVSLRLSEGLGASPAALASLRTPTLLLVCCITSPSCLVHGLQRSGARSQLLRSALRRRACLFSNSSALNVFDVDCNPIDDYLRVSCFYQMQLL